MVSIDLVMQSACNNEAMPQNAQTHHIPLSDSISDSGFETYKQVIDTACYCLGSISCIDGILAFAKLVEADHTCAKYAGSINDLGPIGRALFIGTGKRPTHGNFFSKACSNLHAIINLASKLEVRLEISRMKIVD